MKINPLCSQLVGKLFDYRGFNKKNSEQHKSLSEIDKDEALRLSLYPERLANEVRKSS